MLVKRKDMLLADEMESIVLRESIRARTAVAPVSILTTVSLNLLYIPFFLLHQVPYPRIISWSLPIILLILARGAFAIRFLKRLDQSESRQLRRADRVLRLSSIANQVAVGLGVWVVRVPGDDSMVVPMFMTLLMVCWSIGVMANLFSDYRSFIVSMPLMVGINALFWVTHSTVGITIGLSLVLASLFMIFLVRSGTRIFRESILIRFEKDRLVSDLELERENTQKALREAQAANESKAFFMAAASHDIKQPLHALSLLTDTLLMSDPPQAAVSLLQNQKDSIAKMTEHFDALMDMGRFQSGRFDLTPTRFRLGAFARRIDVEIAPLCAKKGLIWTLRVHDAMVFTDEELLLRALRNLLTNAVQFTEFGEVRCITQMRGEKVELVVSDTGCGIPPEQHAEVFREFVRIKPKGQTSSGAGLGLSIVAKIDQALRLGLHMTSTVGVGTQFSFYLPTAAEADIALTPKVLPPAT